MNRSAIPWQRTLIVMVTAQIIMSMSVSLSWPFLPLYLAELGIHPISTASMWAGLIIGPQFLLAAMVSPFWGVLADRVGRKAMVLRCSCATAVFTCGMGFAQDVWQLLALSFGYGIFSGFQAAAMALVGTSVPEQRLGYALGWMSTAQLAGTLIGPLLGGVLADSFHSYREVFFFTSLTAAITVVLTALLVREVRPSTEAAFRQEGSQRRMLWGLLQNRELAPMFVVLLLSQIAASALSPIIAPYARSLLGPDSHWVATAAGAAIAATGFAGLLSSPLLGRHSDRIGYRKTLLISILGVALFTLPQALSHSIWLFIVLRSGVGIFLGGILPAANAWIGRLYPREQRGRVFGLASAATSFGNFLGPLTGGIVAAHFGIPTVFIVVTALLLCDFVWICVATERAPSFR